MSVRIGSHCGDAAWPSLAAEMTQPAVARFEAGGTVPTIPLLERLARALEAELVVRLDPKTSAA